MPHLTGKEVKKARALAKAGIKPKPPAPVTHPTPTCLPATRQDVWSNDDMATWLEGIVSKIRDGKIDVVSYHVHNNPGHALAERHFEFEYRFMKEG